MDHLTAPHARPEKINSLNHALHILDEASDESASEIRSMLNKDYSKLKRLMNDMNPSIRTAMTEIKDAATTSMVQAKEKMVAGTKDAAIKLDQSVHKNPWVYLGGVATASALAGFLLGKQNKKH